MLSGVGYEGRTPGALIAELRAAGVDVVVDVRLHPMSRRRGFSKRALAEVLAANGFEYVHEPTLGNPVENRPAFRTEATRDSGRARYRELVEGEGAAALERLVALAQDAHVSLLCVERDDAACHRSVLVDIVAGELGRA